MSTPCTSAPRAAAASAVLPKPHPTSSIRSPGRGSSASMSASLNGLSIRSYTASSRTQLGPPSSAQYLACSALAVRFASFIGRRLSRVVADLGQRKRAGAESGSGVVVEVGVEQCMEAVDDAAVADGEAQFDHLLGVEMRTQ